MVTVTLASGTTQVDGDDWSVLDGALTVLDSSGNGVALFAAGIWQSVEVNTS